MTRSPAASLQTRLRWRLHGAWVRTRELVEGFVSGERGPLPPWRLRNIGGGDFRGVGREFLRIFVDHAGLEPHHRVLDMGCGVGRMALPLLDYLEPPGSYDGVDVVAESIDWCRRRIGAQRADFRFHHADLRHPVYNPSGTMTAEEYRFPFASGSFDFVFLTSVFTHLLEPATCRYLAEAARVLRPGGRMLATFFLLPAAGGPAPAGAAYAFAHRLGAAWVEDAAQPGKAVAYEELWLRRQIETADLELEEPVHYGQWSGRPDGLSLQDVVVARRSETAAGAQAGRQTK